MTNVRTVFNNDRDNSSGLGLGRDSEFYEHYSGQWIPIAAQKARYVRLYSRGNTSDPQNQYTEVEVWATSANENAVPVTPVTGEPKSPAPQAPTSIEPGEGEIMLEGIVERLDSTGNSLYLAADAFLLPGKTRRAIRPAKVKVINFDPAIVSSKTVSTKISIRGRIAVIGLDRGSGMPLGANRILILEAVSDKTVNQGAVFNGVGDKPTTTPTPVGNPLWTKPSGKPAAKLFDIKSVLGKSPSQVQKILRVGKWNTEGSVFCRYALPNKQGNVNVFYSKGKSGICYGVRCFVRYRKNR